MTKKPSVSKPREKELDRAFEQALKDSPAFVEWLLSKTGFAGRGARYAWSRSNSPWCRMTVMPDDASGEPRSVESETDILAVFVAEDGGRFALHVENKLANGKFTKGQPDLYAKRAQLWLHKPAYGSYSEFETVLIAPLTFRAKHAAEAEAFDRFISHEEIAAFINLFQQPVVP